MSCEVEIKARVSNSEDCNAKEVLDFKRKIDAFVKAEGHKVKKDDHYFSDQEPNRARALVKAGEGERIKRFRIREELDGLLITTKRNARDDEGVEHNLELEFEHKEKADREMMVQMAKLLGFEEYLNKKKEGWEWHYEDTHIELLSVLHVGTYLEMEISSPSNDKEQNKPYVDELYGILTNLGLKKEDVDPRSYQGMLLSYEEKRGGR